MRVSIRPRYNGYSRASRRVAVGVSSAHPRLICTANRHFARDRRAFDDRFILRNLAANQVSCPSVSTIGGIWTISAPSGVQPKTVANLQLNRCDENVETKLAVFVGCIHLGCAASALSNAADNGVERVAHRESGGRYHGVQQDLDGLHRRPLDQHSALEVGHLGPSQ